MIESASEGNPGVKKLVLGFDAGCLTCSELARRIEERVGGTLEVRSLHDPQVGHWRERALGTRAPWAPTLFEVGGIRGVRAWTGPRMALRLALVLGPASTYGIIRTLGEVSATNFGCRRHEPRTIPEVHRGCGPGVRDLRPARPFPGGRGWGKRGGPRPYLISYRGDPRPRRRAGRRSSKAVADEKGGRRRPGRRHSNPGPNWMRPGDPRRYHRERHPGPQDS